MHKRLQQALALAVLPAAAIACALTPAAASAWSGTAASAATAAQPATRAAGITPATPLRCHASMTNARPSDYTSTGVKVRTIPYAHVTTVAHYRTTNHLKRRIANSHGRRTVWYYVSGATPGFRVIVDVYVARHGHKGSCSTSFVPGS